jgi:hypothetical protein
VGIFLFHCLFAGFAVAVFAAVAVTAVAVAAGGGDVCITDEFLVNHY